MEGGDEEVINSEKSSVSGDSQNKSLQISTETIQQFTSFQDVQNFFQ